MTTRYASGRREGITEELVSALADYEAGPFAEREKTALRYADRMYFDHHTVDDALFAEVRARFSEDETLELTWVIAEFIALRKDLGLDQPLWVQYGAFVKNLVHGDFGSSFYYRAPVLELYLSRLPHSLLLATTAMVFSLLIGIPSGVLAAVRVNGWGDGAGKVFALLGLSMPSFWVGLLMILFFSVYLGWLPSSGSGTPTAASRGTRRR